MQKRVLLTKTLQGRADRRTVPVVVPEARDLDFENPFKWILKHERDNLIRTRVLPKSGRKEYERYFGNGSHYQVDVAILQSIHLRKLQCKLVNHAVNMRFYDMEPDGWENDLESFGKCLLISTPP